MELTRCPLCGSRRIRRIRETIRLGKGPRAFTVPDLSFERCFNCREGFFDHEANRIIDRYQLPRPKARARS